MSELRYKYCAAGDCRVMIFNPKERYCQHHEGLVIFDAAYGTSTRAPDKDGPGFWDRMSSLFRS